MEKTETIQAKVWEVLESITDPEIPVLTVVDLGIIRSVKVEQIDNLVQVNIEVTPTYTGCPAMDLMKMNIRMGLLAAGFSQPIITEILSPAWTTDWISENGKQKLIQYGIAAPQHLATASPSPFGEKPIVPCPQCNSIHTEEIAEFGSTACKSLYKCKDCKEPFDYFKCH